MSIAVLVSAVRTCAGVSEGTPDLSSAAIAAACGAAAEVPKNGLKPGAAVDTPSAAVMTGCWRTTPPENVRLPGVSSAPLGLRITRRGPSELKLSLALPELNWFGYGPTGGTELNTAGPAGVAATP